MTRFCLIILLGLTSLAYGQWVPEGLVITHNELADYDMCTDGNSGAIVVWDYYDGQDLDIKVQHVDSAGYFQWGPDGIMVYEDDSLSQQYINVISDGQGGAFVSWRDFRDVGEGGPDIYGQYIDSLGNLVWPIEGVCVFNKPSGQLLHDVILDGQGGIIVVAEDEHDGRHLIIQRIDKYGNYVWPDSGIYIFTSTSHWFNYPKLVKVDSENFVCVWQYMDYYGSPTEYDIYAQKFNLDGEIAWQENGIPIVVRQGDQEEAKIIPDSQGGIVATWIDDLSHHTGVYADRIDSSGISRWQQNGRLISSLNISIKDIRLFDLAGNFIVFWWPYVEDTLYSQIITFNGERVWTEGGKILYLHNKVLQPIDIVTSGNLDFEFVTNYDSFFNYVPYIGAKTDTAGTDYWPNRPFLDTYILNELLEVISDDLGGLIACWRVMMEYDIRIQRIYPNGRVGGDTTTAISEPEDNPIPIKINLYQNYPNPFNAQTVIRFNLPLHRTGYYFSIFDINGRLVRHFNLTAHIAGNNFITWKGDDDYGCSVASGIYFGVLSSLESCESIKLNLIK